MIDPYLVNHDDTTEAVNCSGCNSDHTCFFVQTSSTSQITLTVRHERMRSSHPVPLVLPKASVWAFFPACPSSNLESQDLVRSIASITLLTPSSMGSCVHMRITVQPHDLSREVWRRSLARLPRILESQYQAFARGALKCSGHPCQKHESMKTATLALVKTTSGRAFPAAVRISRSLRNRSPSRCRADLSSSSGTVSVRRFALIVARAPGLDGRRGRSGLMSLNSTCGFPIGLSPQEDMEYL